MGFFVCPTLFSGAPEDLAACSPQARDCYALLKKLNIPFMRVDHDPANSIDDCRKVEEVIGVHICKNLFLQNRQGSVFYLLMMAGDKPFRTAQVSRLLGVSRLSFGSPDALMRLLCVKPGSVSILALKDDVKKRVNLLMDEDIFRAEYLRCHPCDNRVTLKIKTADVREIFLPFVGHAPQILRLPTDKELS